MINISVKEETELDFLPYDTPELTTMESFNSEVTQKGSFDLELNPKEVFDSPKFTQNGVKFFQTERIFTVDGNQPKTSEMAKFTQ